MLLEKCNVAHQVCIGFIALSATRLRIPRVDLQLSCPISSNREWIGCFLTPSLRLACVQFATPGATEFCGAPLAPLVVLAVATSSPIRLSEILVSRPIVLMSQVAFLFRRKDVLTTIKVRSLHLLMSVLY